MAETRNLTPSHGYPHPRPCSLNSLNRVLAHQWKRPLPYPTIGRGSNCLYQSRYFKIGPSTALSIGRWT